MTVLIPILLIVASCVIIWRACDGFEAASDYLGRNLSEGVRGATINAIGSSIPELLTTIFFLFVMNDSDGFSGGIGTTAGSAVFNAVIIPAAVILVVTMYGIVKQVQVSKKVVLRDGIALLLAEFVLIYFMSGTELYWWHGGILMLMYVIYITYMFTTMKKNEEEEEEEEDDDDDDDGDGNRVMSALTLDLEGAIVGKNDMTSALAWPLIIAATLVIGAACYILVYACENLGHALEIPVYFVAVVLAAAATSVPDTIISIRDGLKGNYDDAVSNAIGSNIFDICFALGLPLFLYTIIYEPIVMSADTIENISELRILLLIVTFVAIVLFYVGKGMAKGKAILLLLLYLVFLFYVLGRATQSELAADIATYLHAIGDVINGWRFW